MKSTKHTSQRLVNRLLHIHPTDSDPIFVIKSLVKRFFTDDVGGSAAQMAYYILFSFFPFLIFLNALLGLSHVPVADLMPLFQRLFPEEVVMMIQSYFWHVTSIRSPLLLVSGLVMAYYSLSRGIKYLILALRRAYRMSEENNTTLANIISLCFTFLIFVTIIVMAILTSVSGSMLQQLWNILRLPQDWLRLWDILRFVLIGVITVLVLGALYYAIPLGRYPFRCALPGTAISLFCVLAASIGFSWYVNNIASYSVIYGSLGAVIILMLWLFMMGNIIIAGGEINHILLQLRQHRQLRRQQTGKGRPRVYGKLQTPPHEPH